MAEDIVQLPADSTGKKLRTRSRSIAGNTVHEQGMFLAAAESFVAYANAVVFAANKHHIDIFNAAGSGKIVKVKKLFAVNLQTVAVTGIVNRFDVKKSTNATGGTAVTPEKLDSDNANLPAGITVGTGRTVTEGNVLFPWLASSEEETAVVALSKSLFQQAVNILMEGNEIQELTLREGQGMTVKQITSSAVGSFGWILVFTVE